MKIPLFDQIARLEAQLETLQCMSSVVGASVASSADIDSVRRQLEDARRAAAALIGTLTDPKHAKILLFRYLDHMQFKDIAAALGYSLSNVYFSHREALKEVEGRARSVCGEECPGAYRL